MMDILDTLRNLHRRRGDEVEAWFIQKRHETPPFFYSSVDLRHSRTRLAPVDTNLFPAGFNNLSPHARDRAVRFIKLLFEERFPQAKRVLIVPENHTRNLGYLENLATLSGLVTQAGFEVQIGSLVAQPGSPILLDTPSGGRITEQPMQNQHGRLELENGFVPDVVIMNNDMTAGAPELLADISQPVVPPLGMGWYRRRKSVHFDMYRGLVREFSALFGLDAWLLCADFYHCGLVDFKERTGLEKVARAIDRLLAGAREKHRQYGITDDPYMFVKADSGTYGMGIMTVRSGEEILELNKKERNKMQTIKEGARVSELIIQEGVPTVDVIDGKPAEPMIYMIDGLPVGGMWRVNGSRDALTNLNAAGMEFRGMCDEVEEECGQWKALEDCHFRSFGTIAAIAALAAARENYDSFMLYL